MTKPCCGVPVKCLEPDAECVTREMHQRQTLKDSLPLGIYRVGLTGGGEDVVEKCTDGWVHSDDDQGNPGAPFTGDILWANPIWNEKPERPIYHPLRDPVPPAAQKGYAERQQAIQDWMRAPAPTSPLATQVGGSHYKTMKIQPLEYCHANNIGKIEGDVIAYVSRWRAKNGIEDLRKAIHELQILIELENAQAKT